MLFFLLFCFSTELPSETCISSTSKSNLNTKMVNNIFNKLVITSPIVRSFCWTTSLSVDRLMNRSVVNLFGKELFGFVQGLITNDVFSLKEPQNSLYTFLLNNKGRILYDALLYKISNQELLLECDSVVKDDIMRHIKAYCVRKKINVVPQDSSVWAVFNNKHIDELSDMSITQQNTSDLLRSPEIEIDIKKVDDSASLYLDPRLSVLGARIISSPSVDILQLLTERGVNVSSNNSLATFRYKLGVAEGVNELPVGSCFPHEANGDYLRGINFAKGCYIGQELTARVQHTGVVRKRLMPIILSSVPDSSVEENAPIMLKDGKNIGKIRVLRENYGIALLRVTEALENKSNLELSGITARTYKPYWWPQ